MTSVLRRALLAAAFLAAGLSLALPMPAAASSWFALPQPPAQAFRHQDISVVSPTRAWVVSGIGTVYKTIDGGVNWIPLVILPSYLRSVGFADSLHGWIGTLTPDSLLYATQNGGSSWTLVQNLPEPKPAGICGLWVVNPSVVYGCGTYYGPPRVIKTTDGGATWSVIDLSAYATTLIDCYFPTPDSGFVFGGLGAFPDATRGVVVATTDGGATWATRFVGTPAGEWCWKATFPTRNVGYASLQSIGAPVGFLKTTDGGATWERKPFLSTHYGAQGIGFATESIGWMGGEGVLYATQDGGETWQQEDWGRNLNRFRFVNDSLGFAAGGQVYKYDVNDPTSVASGPEAQEYSGANDAILYQNAPNPFRAATTVEFVLDAPGVVNLAVYDLAGRRIASLVHARLNAGPHLARWDGRNDAGREMASGAYVYRLETAAGRDAKRMLLMR